MLLELSGKYDMRFTEMAFHNTVLYITRAIPRLLKYRFQKEFGEYIESLESCGIDP